MAYVDGFILSVPKDRFEEYRAMAELGRLVWMEYGALSYVESRADDVPYGELTSFPRAVNLPRDSDDVVIFASITYASRDARDQIIAKVMSDPRMKYEPGKMPFDGKTMIYGGFETFVES